MEPARDYEYYLVDEVLNYGGFFGGNTVTLYGRTPDRSREDPKFIIAEQNFENLRDGDRFKEQEGELLGLILDGDEVRAARLAGAPTRQALREATATPPPDHNDPGPRALSYFCAHDNLWMYGQPPRRDGDGPYYCAVCGHDLTGG